MGLAGEAVRSPVWTGRDAASLSEVSDDPAGPGQPALCAVDVEDQAGGRAGYGGVRTARQPVGDDNPANIVMAGRYGRAALRRSGISRRVQRLPVDEPGELGEGDAEYGGNDGAPPGVDAGGAGLPLRNGVFGNADLFGERFLIETGTLAGVPQLV
jgi:hypothetical protein